MSSYLMIILFPTILYFIDENTVVWNGSLKKLAIVFLIIISTLRYGFGADYYTYSAAFDRIQNGIMTDKFEWGYTLLNIIIAKIGLPFQGLLFVIAVFNLVLIYKSIEEYVDKYKWLSLFLYLAYFDLFFYSLSALRQSIVISIVIYSFKYIQKRNFKRYTIWLLFGSLFHNSALIMIPVYFLYQFLRKQNFISTSIIMISITVIYKFSINFIGLIQPYLSNKLNYYFFIFDNSKVSYSLLYVFIAEVTMLAWIYCSCYLKKKKLGEEDESYMYFLAITFFLCLKIFQYMQYYSLIPRLEMYFYSVFIIAAPNFIVRFYPKLRPLLTYSIFILFIIIFVFRYFEINQTYLYYYQTFKLIFNK